jgi:acyl-CoA thioesterase-1
MTKQRCLRALCWLALLPAAALAWEKDKPATPPVIPPNPHNLPQVLLIGDSISSGYYHSVAKALEGKAVVAKSSDNGESTAVGVKKIDGWLGDTKWDVIHFNWGVWDMYGWQYAADDRSPAMYAQRLDTLVVRMKKTGARLIWATTTPVPPKPESTMLKRWKTEVVIDQDLERQYQEEALQVMKKHNVQVNDLYALLKPRRSEFQADDDVHFSGGGSALMAGQVADCILKNLGSAMEKRDADPKRKPATPALAGKPDPYNVVWDSPSADARGYMPYLARRFGRAVGQTPAEFRRASRAK